MKGIMEKAQALLELGGIKRDIVFLAISGLALLVSIFDLLPLPFDAAWAAIILCGPADYRGSRHRTGDGL